MDLLKSLDHPNIVGYVENFLLGDTLVIVMQSAGALMHLARPREATSFADW